MQIIKSRLDKPGGGGLKFSDIQVGQVYTYGTGEYIYMKAHGECAMCLTDARVTGYLDDSLHYDLRILEAELHVKD